MTLNQCPHCGQAHPAGTIFCSATGRPLQASPAAPPPPQQPPPQYAQTPQPPYGYAAPPQAPPPYGSPVGHPQGGYGQAPPPGPAGYGAPPQASPGYGPPQGGYGAAGYGQAGYGAPGPGGYPQPPYGQPPQGPPYGSPPYGGQAPQAPGYGVGSQFAAPGSLGAKPIGAILTEAFQLYQKNLGTLLLTCAILLVPVSLAKSAAMALILAPTAVVDVAASHAQQLSQRTAQDIQKQLQEADPKKRQELMKQQQKEMQDLQQAWAATGTAAVGGLMAILLGLVAALIGIALMYGIAIPLTTGALTILVADRSTGGNFGPGKAYGRLLRRLGALLSAAIPAFFLVLVGLCLLVIPGLIVGFLFVFVTPVVLLENVGGIAALKRSVALVRANVGQVAIVCLVFAAIRIVAQIVGGIFVPRSALFLGSFVQDALLMLVLPIPILGTVLLYLDIRRQSEGLDDRALRAALDA